MEDAYGIGITNRYDFLVDTDTNDLQAILKQKAKKAKKAAKKLAGKENSENDNGKVEIKSDKVNDEKKAVKFVAPGKGGRSQSSSQPAQEPAQKSRSMKDTQNIQGEGNTENNGMNRTRETKNNFDRERNYGNNNRNERNFENRENREQRFNRRNKDGGLDPTDAANETSNENGSVPPNRGYRNGYRNNENRNNENRNNENNSNGQDIEYNNQRDQRDRDNDRPARRQGYNDRNFGNRERRYDGGQRRNFDGRGGKREFDRQSGSDKTGVKAVEKRDGGGAHNWGSHRQDIEDLDKNVNEAELKDDGISVENAKSSEENLAVVVEPQFYTYDEYLAQKAERAKPVFNLRKAGEGEDKKKWKNMVPLQKNKEDVKSEDEYEFDPSQYPQRKRGLKFVTDIKVCFNEGKRVGNFNNKNDRRRQPKNSDGRRQNDGDKRQNAPQVDDRNFPSLG